MNFSHVFLKGDLEILSLPFPSDLFSVGQIILELMKFCANLTTTNPPRVTLNGGGLVGESAPKIFRKFRFRGSKLMVHVSFL